MFGQTRKAAGKADGEGERGAPPGAEDEELPSGSVRDEDDLAAPELDDRDFGWEEGDPADRRRDPLRKP